MLTSIFKTIIPICASLTLFCASIYGVTSSDATVKDDKIHVVVAVPYRPDVAFDPHWYSPEFITYMANLLPSDQYEVSGYFVSLENIPVFLDDMKALYDQKPNMRVLNFCDGGEWDGYPGFSVVKAWAKHPIAKLIPMSGGNAEFILQSDDKTVMQAHIAKANLTSLPQALVPAKMLSEEELRDMLAKQKLDQSWPLFCKLNIGWGALGIGAASICNNVTELMAQLHKMHSSFPASDILVQPYLPGPEYTVLVLKDKVYAAIRRDFHNSYNVMEEDYVSVGSVIENEITFLPAPESIHQVALNALKAIPGTYHYVRIDMRNDAKGNTYVIDINDRPGLGDPSTVKFMLDFNHLSESEFIQALVKTCSLNDK